MTVTDFPPLSLSKARKSRPFPLLLEASARFRRIVADAEILETTRTARGTGLPDDDDDNGASRAQSRPTDRPARLEAPRTSEPRFQAPIDTIR